MEEVFEEFLNSEDKPEEEEAEEEEEKEKLEEIYTKHF